MTANDITKYRVRRNHTVRTAVGLAVSTCIFVVSYDQLMKSSDEMSTKT